MNEHRFWHYARTQYTQAPWPDPCLWLGVTAENQRRLKERAPDLFLTPAAIRFVSVEPMLGPVDAREWLTAQPWQERLSWVICGGETGPGARLMDVDWVRSLRDQCVAAGVPFWFKGGPGYPGGLLDGREWHERPGQGA